MRISIAISLLLFGTLCFGQENFLKLCENGTIEQISAAIHGGASVKQRDKDGSTPLLHASMKNRNAKVVSLLLGAGATVSEHDSADMTALAYAAYFNPNPEVMLALIEAGSSVVSTDVSGMTPLLYALIGNKTHIAVSWLMQKGASATENSGDGETAITLAAKFDEDPDVIEMLIGAGASATDKDANGDIPLNMAAAYNKNPAVVRLLLSKGGHLNAEDSAGYSPIIRASMTNTNPEIITTLLDAGASLSDTNNKYGLVPLEAAIRYQNRNPAVVEVLIQAGASAKEPIRGTAPLMLALEGIRGASPEVVSILLKAGAPVEERNKAGKTALMAAAESGASPEIVSLLLEAGASASDRDENEDTPLLFAAKGNNNPDVIGLLLRAGASIDEADKDGMTPLLWAAANSNTPEVIAAILGAGGAVNDRNKEGWTPLMFAARRDQKPEWWTVPTQNHEVVSLLVSFGGSVNIQAADGTTPLLLAIEANNYSEIGALLKAGASVVERASDGLTPLMVAIKSSRDADVLRWLLENGARVTDRDPQGMTPLLFASQAARWATGNDFCSLLIRAGASVKERDNNGVTPLMFAIKFYSLSVVRSLLSAGADAAEKDNDGRTAFDYAKENADLVRGGVYGDLIATLQKTTYVPNTPIEEVHRFSFGKPFNYFAGRMGDEISGAVDMFFSQDGNCLIGGGWSNHYFVYDKNWTTAKELPGQRGRPFRISSTRYVVLGSFGFSHEINFWVYTWSKMDNPIYVVQTNESSLQNLSFMFLAGDMIFGVDSEDPHQYFSWELSRPGGVVFRGGPETALWLLQHGDELGWDREAEGFRAGPARSAWDQINSKQIEQIDWSQGKTLGIAGLSKKDLHFVGTDGKGLIYTYIFLPWTRERIEATSMAAYCFVIIDIWQKKAIFRNLGTGQHFGVGLPEAVSPDGNIWFFEVDTGAGQFVLSRIVNTWWKELRLNSIIAATGNDNKVRIRENSGLQSKIVSYLYENDIVRIVSKSSQPDLISGESAYWYKIVTLDGREGWVFGRFLNMN